MADSGSVIGQFTDEIEQTAKEVTTDVKDSFGEAIEQGIQAVVGPQFTPQQIQQQQEENQQKQQQDQQKLAEARRKIGFYQKVEQEQSQARVANRQKEKQRLEGKQQEEQTEHIEKEQKKKEAPIIDAGKAEIKKGVGG